MIQAHQKGRQCKKQRPPEGPCHREQEQGRKKIKIREEHAGQDIQYSESETIGNVRIPFAARIDAAGSAETIQGRVRWCSRKSMRRI